MWYDCILSYYIIYGIICILVYVYVMKRSDNVHVRMYVCIYTVCTSSVSNLHIKPTEQSSVSNLHIKSRLSNRPFLIYT